MLSLEAQAGVLLLACGYLVWRHGRRALHVLVPGRGLLEAQAEGEAVPVPDALSGMVESIRALGFVRIGAHQERLAENLTDSDVWDFASESLGVFLSLYVVRDALGLSHRARIVLLSPCAGGGIVRSADHKCPGRDVPGRFLSGCLAGVPLERLVKAHQRRVGELGPPEGPWTLDACVEVVRRWRAGPGAFEIRVRHSGALVWLMGALALGGAALVRLLSR